MNFKKKREDEKEKDEEIEEKIRKDMNWKGKERVFLLI